MPFAKVNGTELYYEVHGQGAPVVLAHGGASNHISWFNQVVALRDHYTVVTYDQRGFGFSEENGDYQASAFEDLRELLDHLGYGKVALLGQSLGGVVVAGFTSRYPERVRALVLSSTPAGLVDTGRRSRCSRRGHIRARRVADAVFHRRVSGDHRGDHRIGDASLLKR